MTASGYAAPDEPRPIIPALGRFYAWSRDLSYLVLRLTAGGMLLVHGIVKLTSSTVAGFAASGLARRGIEPSLPLAYLVWFMETAGAVGIMLGLFTRIFAVGAIIEFAVIIFVAHWKLGFFWTRPGGGWEYPLLWGLLFVVIALRGGGPYSLDRRIGREF